MTRLPLTSRQRTPESFRAMRRRRANAKLREKMKDLVSAVPGARFIGHCAQMRSIALSMSFEEHEMAMCRIEINGAEMCLVGIPHAVWKSPGGLGRLTEMQSAAQRAGIFCIMLPQAIVEIASATSKPNGVALDRYKAVNYRRPNATRSLHHDPCDVLSASTARML